MRMFAAILMGAALGACATAPAGSAAPMQLSGTSWLRVDDENANPHGATLEFQNARASGYTGCNRWFAAVTQDGDALRFGDVGMTRMACQTPMQSDTERNLLSVLGRVRYVQYDRDELVFLDERRTPIALFASNS